MKQIGKRRGPQHGGTILSLLAVILLALGSPTVRAETLLTCVGIPGGDLIERGFYLPHFPGNSLDSARLSISASTPGTYSMTLTARAGAYDGRILGTATETFLILGAEPQNRPVTFTFPSVRITEGSRVCFTMSARIPVGVSLFFGTSATSGGCTTVIETEGTTPPLDTFRRNGVDLVITGQDTLIVAPGESIQAAIDAASVGDTVNVDPGTYTENIHLRSGIDVVGAGYNRTILRGLGNTNVVTAIGISDTRMEGFKITRSGDGSFAGVNIVGGSVQFNNNWIAGNKNGVRISGGSSAIIRNNLIQANGDPDDGLLDYGVLSLSSTPLIANNLIHSNSGAGLYFAWAASTGAQVLNNTVADNTDDGIWCYNGANVTIKNNIFTRNSAGITASHGAVPLISFNDVWGNRWLNYNPQSGGLAAAGPGDISVDPRFDTAASPPYLLQAVSPCINAGDPNPLYNDRDGTRNDQGAFGGPSGMQAGLGSIVTTGFLFNNIGKIPTSEITRTGARAGLANVDASTASALYIYPHQDAPFGGNLWIHGLFGSSDNSVRYYRIYVAAWSGSTPPALADFQPITDPLSKIRYSIGPGGIVTATMENIGPDSNGMYLRTEAGYWTYPDLKIVWNTLAVPNGRYDLICKAYTAALVEVPLPANTLSRITLWVNNEPVTATINNVRNRFGVEIPECGVVPLASSTENLQFDFTASHPSGFLRDYALTVSYGRNHSGGTIAADQYVGVHDSTPPVWSGVTGIVSNTAPAHASGALLPWTSCAYEFRLSAWARTTDGFSHLYYATFGDHYSLNLTSLLPTSCVADLDGDGDVDGADLAIFASQFGRTNCIISLP
jgi:parallel beta-helix repeat protein